MRRTLTMVLVLLAACGAEEPTQEPAGGDAPPGTRRVPALRGVVTNEAGDPVPGVAVRARLPYGAGLPGLQGIEATTGTDGAFELRIEERLAPVKDAPVLLTVQAEGYVERTFTLRSFKPGLGQDMEITIHPAGALAGNVLIEREGPAAGGFAYVIRPDAAGAERRTDALGAVIGADGGFTISGLPEGKFDVGVLVEGCVPALVGPV
ncbi:MAG: carboxypeptidase-like regulatory domain-containing protein, partial [Planctomycetota bacterium]